MKEEDYHCIHDWSEKGRHWIERLGGLDGVFDLGWYCPLLSRLSKQFSYYAGDYHKLSQEEIDYLESEYANVAGG